MNSQSVKLDVDYDGLGRVSVDKRQRPARLSWLEARSCTGLMELSDGEAQLDAGRFRCFSLETQAHKVGLLFYPKGWSWMGMNERTTRFVNWIDQNTSGFWSLQMDMASGLAGKHIFSFAEPETATLFILRFE